MTKLDLPARQVVKYLTPHEVRALPPPTWLLESLIPDKGITVLYGPPKVGKSLLALGWCVCIEHGHPWHGRRVLKPGPVLYIAGEGLNGFGKRLDALAEANYPTHIGPIFRDRPVDLLAGLGVEHFLQEIKELPRKPTLIVIDTLARAMVGGDENAAEDMGMAIDRADRIRHATGAAILLIHHATKNNQRVMRGSSALLGAVDTVLALQRDPDGSLELRIEAARDFEAGKQTQLRARPIRDSVVIVPADNYEPETITQEQFMALLILAQSSGALDRTAWREAIGTPERSFARLLVGLEPYVERSKDGRQSIYSITAAGYDILSSYEDEDLLTIETEARQAWEDDLETSANEDLADEFEEEE